MGPRPLKRKPYHHGNLREALIDAAIKCVAGGGLHTLTLREVARLAGVTHQAPYRHFASRPALVAAVAERGFRTLRLRMMEARQKAGADLDAQLGALMRCYVRFAVDEAPLYRVMFSVEVADKSMFPSLQAEADGALLVLSDTIDEAQRLGRVRAGDAIDFVASTWALSHGLASFLLDGQLRRRGFSPNSAEVIANRLLAVLREGLSPRKNQRSKRTRTSR